MRPLIVRLPNWIGDVIMSLPTLWHLHHAGYRLELVGKGWAAPLLAGCGWTVHKLPGGLIQRVSLLRRLARQSRKSDRDFDKRLNTLLLTNSLSSALEARLAGLKTVGYRQDHRGWLLSHPVLPPTEVLHESQRFFALTQSLAPGNLPAPTTPSQARRDTEPALPQLPLTDAARLQARELLRQHGLVQVSDQPRAASPLPADASPAPRAQPASNAPATAQGSQGQQPPSPSPSQPDSALLEMPVRPFICLVPFATGTLKGVNKAWPGFPELCRNLARQFPVLLAPGPGLETQLARREYPDAISLEGVGLDVYAALLAESRLVIANDTGPGHMAAAVGARVVSILGPSDARRYRALGPRVHIIQRTPWPPAAEVEPMAQRMMFD